MKEKDIGFWSIDMLSFFLGITSGVLIVTGSLILFAGVRF